MSDFEYTVTAPESPNGLSGSPEPGVDTDGDFLTRERILAIEDRQIEIVPVPEWGGKVRVKGLNGRERDLLESTIMEQRGRDMKANLQNYRAKLVVLSCVRHDGAPLFNLADVKLLGEKSAAAIARVADVASRLAGLTPADVEELTKNSSDAPSADSIFG